MDTRYQVELMHRLSFPGEAVEDLQKAQAYITQKAGEAAFDAALQGFMQRREEGLDNYENFLIAKTELESLSEKIGLSIYPLWMLFFLEGSQRAEQLFAQRGWPVSLFEHTFQDLRYKLRECLENKGVYGTFVPNWYPIFIFGEILAFGRLQYESRRFDYEKPYIWQDFTLNPGDPIFSLHIPNSGEPLTVEARMDSYRRAYDFYKNQGMLSKEGLLVVRCHSWLLYPPYQEVYPQGSNIWDFAHDFDIIDQSECEFYDFWRIFGPEKDKAPQDLPEKTRLQKAFKQHIIKGGPFGDALGILLFDGEKIVNNNRC